jgi:pimeloyl-ACP methyl ester carboxylesterase
MRLRLKSTVLALSLSLVAASALPSSPSSATVTDKPGACTSVQLPVSLTPGSSANATLAGTLCTPSAWAEGEHSIDVLVAGGMYNSTYWDWPVNPGLYSYVDKTLAAGRATFRYDRIGTGSSTRPLSVFSTFDADVYTLHQVMTYVRNVQGFTVVNVVGHSLGSVIALEESGLYHDTDKVVLTGLTHGHGIGFLTLPANIYPAALDPQFTSLGLDLGYVTTIPGKRSSLFYSSSASPSVISYDEAHKDVMSTTVAAGAIVALSKPPLLNTSNLITQPVLMVLGKLDSPFCNVDVSCATDASVQAYEAPYFTNAQTFTARTVADTGHNLPLHPSANVSFGIIDQWISSP